jgi:hypothetical protein
LQIADLRMQIEKSSSVATSFPSLVSRRLPTMALNYGAGWRGEGTGKELIWQKKRSGKNQKAPGSREEREE